MRINASLEGKIQATDIERRINLSNAKHPAKSSHEGLGLTSHSSGLNKQNGFYILCKRFNPWRNRCFNYKIIRGRGQHLGRGAFLSKFMISRPTA